jgi:hypothetical protein
MHLERAVELNSNNVAARFDLLEYYLRAPPLLGGSSAEARRQAEEISKHDVARGIEAWHLCEQAEEETQSVAPW